MRRLLFIAVAALAVTLTAPVVAGAAVLPQKGIGKVLLGASETDLDKRLTAPSSLIRTYAIDSGLYTTIWSYSGLEIEFEGGNLVTSILTTQNFQRTRKGAGMNTPKRLLKILHPKVRCGKGKNTSCSLGKPRKRGARATTFTILDGKVTSIRVYRVVL